jgi:YVTN family beta-propeller protein
MNTHRSLFLRRSCLSALFGFLSWGAAKGQSTYTHFEARHVHPIGLTPDGTRLLALNTPDARLSVFDVSNVANPEPVLISEIPIGYESVSLRTRTNDEVWVVSELSDSVSIVSLSQSRVVGTLRTPDEPADVIFANGKAFVTCARSNSIRVFDALTRADLGTIALTGNYPRALAASADGSKIYAAFQLSGNRTTVLPFAAAPAQPAPTNPALPAPPQVALIVPASDSRIQYTVLDHDVAEINTATQTVTRYLSDTGTNLYDIAMHPTTGELWAANTDALNLVRFEPVLKGHFADHRLSRIALPASTVTIYDLNPGVNYALLTNPAAQATALAQPTALVFANDGTHGWVAAFNSDRVAKVSSSGAVLARVDVRPVTANGAREMRGPRGLALMPDGSRLFVLNKLSNSISVVDTSASSVISEVPTGSRDPMPTAIKEGRGFLFDARLSGNGLGSCAICHPDGDRDGLAWDLGDPGGAMLTVVGKNNSIHDLTPKNRVMHPMKGPMTTQTLRGLKNPSNMPAGTPAELFHWRGDRPTIQSFDVTYRDLMAGSLPSAAEMALLKDYLFSLLLHPNPFRGLNRAMPATFNGANPNTGRVLFLDHLTSHCVACHILPTGSDNNIDLNHIVDSSQPVKTVHLRTVYQRSNFSRNAGAVNVSGFGLLKDGTGNELAIAHFYDLQSFTTAQQFHDVAAFVQCFDTGVAPAVGYNLTVTTSNRTASTITTDLATMEGQAVANCNLVARGVVAGRWRSFLYSSTSQTYSSDDSTETALTRTALLNLLSGNDTLTFMGVPAGQGSAQSIDRDADGLRNAQEPLPNLEALPSGASVVIQWPAADSGWVLESSPNLQSTWQTVTLPRTRTANAVQLNDAPGAASARFYRLRRTW